MMNKIQEWIEKHLVPVVNKITKISSTYVKYLLSYVVKIKRKVYVV